jgi:hypothetical protein
MKLFLAICIVIGAATYVGGATAGNPTFGSGVGAAKKACLASGGTWWASRQVCQP